MAKSSSEERLARMDEKLGAVHEYIVNEIRPAIKEVVSMRETVRWLKAGVFGVYGIFGSFIIMFLTYLYQK